MFNRRISNATSRNFNKKTSQTPQQYQKHSRSRTLTFDVQGKPDAPDEAKGVHVTYTNDPEEVKAWLVNNVVANDTKVLGFDVEWKPQFIAKKLGGRENKVAVMQLSTKTDTLVLHLFHIHTIPKHLVEVLTDDSIIKVGCGIHSDVAKLLRDSGLQCKGALDLAHLALKSGHNSQSGRGLKALALKLLGIEIVKQKRIQLSNWEFIPLSKHQICYAAMDAWIGGMLYYHMQKSIRRVNIGQSEVDGLIDPLPKDISIVYCKVCGKKCKGEEILKEHMTKSNHSQCPDCGMMFVSDISKKHRRRCSGTPHLINESL